MAKAKRRTVYRGRIFDVEELVVPHTGNKIDVVTGFDSVAVLPILKNNKLLLERQYRYTIGKHLYEVPAGRMEKGERPIAAARRELEEETGYLAKRLRHLFSSYPGPGHAKEFMHVYLAENLKKTRVRRDEDEMIELKEVSVRQALEMIRKNKIKDHKTIATILYYLNFMKKE